MLHRWKETPGVPLSGFERGWKEKNERGTKEEGALSNVQRRKARGTQKLKRARAPLKFERQLESMRVPLGSWAKPLKRRYQARGFGRKTYERNISWRQEMDHEAGRKP
jgi:hypothetical protein